jgi:hypothetical protein
MQFKAVYWPVIAIITYFLSLFASFSGVGALIAIFELVFFVTSIKAISNIDMKGGVLKGFGILGFAGFLALWGFATVFGGSQIGIHSSTSTAGMGLVFLGILTVMLAAFTYYELKYRREKVYKESKIEKEAYLKRKGELEAERELNNPK